MIELNLLPKEFRKKKKRTIVMSNLPILPAVAGIVVVLVIIHMSLSILTVNKKNSLKILQKKWTQIQPQRKQTEKVARESASLRKKLASIRKIAKPEMDWTRLLGGLNQAVIQDVWLLSFKLKFTREQIKIAKKKGRKKKEVIKGKEVLTSLNLAGYALGTSERATSIVAKFITSLENVNDFTNYFKDIELENMRNDEVAGEEVMKFNLVCSFKKKEIKAKKAVSKTKRKK